MNIRMQLKGRPARTAVAVLAAATLGLTAGGTATASTTAPAGKPPASAPGSIVITRNVTFGGGVPVGGRTLLILNPDGTYSWSGHMHDSGATSYSFSGVCVVRFSSGTAFAFETRGRLHGTFDSGSRDHNWNKPGYKAELPAAWRASSSYRWACNNRTTLDLNGLVNSAITAVGYAARVIAIVA
ncbi:hypothetical protein [Streptomyces sp. NPDC054804]